MPLLDRFNVATASEGYRLGYAAFFDPSGFALYDHTVVPGGFVRAFYPVTNNSPSIAGTS